MPGIDPRRRKDKPSRVPDAVQREASRAFTPVFAGYGEAVRR